MRLRLNPREPIARSIRTVARQESDRALAVIAHGRPLSGPNVHALRKSLKRLRALMKLVEQPGRGRLRKASQTLAPIRDVDVVRATLKTLAKERGLLPPGAMRKVDAHLRACHTSLVRAYRENARFTPVEEAVRETAARFARWRATRPGFAVCTPGLTRAHRRCRKALIRAAARGTGTDFHEWRKRLSVVRDHLLLIASPGSQLHAEALALDRAVTSLGDDHNLVVVLDTLEKLSSEQPIEIDLARLRRNLARRQARLRREAFTAASELCLRDSNGFGRHVVAAWERSRSRRGR